MINTDRIISMKANILVSIQDLLGHHMVPQFLMNLHDQLLRESCLMITTVILTLLLKQMVSQDLVYTKMDLNICGVEQGRHMELDLARYEHI